MNRFRHLERWTVLFARAWYMVNPHSPQSRCVEPIVRKSSCFGIRPFSDCMLRRTNEPRTQHIVADPSNTSWCYNRKLSCTRANIEVVPSVTCTNNTRSCNINISNLAGRLRNYTRISEIITRHTITHVRQHRSTYPNGGGPPFGAPSLRMWCRCVLTSLIICRLMIDRVFGLPEHVYIIVSIYIYIYTPVLL